MNFCCCRSYYQDEIKFTGQVNFCNIYLGLILTASMKSTEILELQPQGAGNIFRRNLSFKPGEIKMKESRLSKITVTFFVRTLEHLILIFDSLLVPLGHGIK